MLIQLHNEHQHEGEHAVKITREELAVQVDVAQWSWLRAHLERGGLIVVNRGLDLVEVGASIASDDTAVVGDWIQTGLLAKPSAEQISAWDANEEISFSALIISPYVLIQEQKQ